MDKFEEGWLRKVLEEMDDEVSSWMNQSYMKPTEPIIPVLTQEEANLMLTNCLKKKRKRKARK